MALTVVKLATPPVVAVPPRVMSEAVNPVTSSPNVTWKLIGLAFVGELWVEVMVGVGLFLSEVIEYWVAALLLFPAKSVKVFAAMLTRIVPSAVDRKSTRLNSSHIPLSRMPSSA